MLVLKSCNRFEKDIDLAKKRKKDLEKLWAVVEILKLGQDLAKKFRAHKLVGNWKDFWECHIEPDWLLIYRITENEIHLIRTGTHSDLGL